MFSDTAVSTDLTGVTFGGSSPKGIEIHERAVAGYQEAVADLERLAWGCPEDTNEEALELEVSAMRLFARGLRACTTNAMGRPFDGQEDLERIFSKSHWELLSNDEVNLSDDYCYNHYGRPSGQSAGEPD